MVYAIPFDTPRLELRGGPVSVLQGVEQGAIPYGHPANLSVSANGSVMYARGGTADRMLAWLDRSGQETPLSAPPRAYTYPRISPDGGRIALDVRDQENDLWVWDLNRATLTRLTFDPGNDQYPTWTPDGKRIIFNSNRANDAQLFWKPADGTGTDEQLAKAQTLRFAQSVSPDGRFVVYRDGLPGGGSDLGLLDVTTRQQRLLIKTPYSEQNGEISPDGRWLAYESNESGQSEVYVRPFPEVDKGRWQVSTGGGVQPLWRRDGRELYYRTTQRLMAVPIQTTAGFVASSPQALFETARTSWVLPGAPTTSHRTAHAS